MKLIKQCTIWSLMLALILHLLDMVVSLKAYAHLLMNACVMVYLIHASSRFCKMAKYLHLQELWVIWFEVFIGLKYHGQMQDGDIINIDVTVYLNVYSSFHQSYSFRKHMPLFFLYVFTFVFRLLIYISLDWRYLSIFIKSRLHFLMMFEVVKTLYYICLVQKITFWALKMHFQFFCSSSSYC